MLDLKICLRMKGRILIIERGISMHGYIVLIAFATMIILVIGRSRQMKKLGLKAIQFGAQDKKDFIIPPFVLLYFYLIIANTFNLPRFGSTLLDNAISAWVGTGLSVIAPFLFLWGMVSFGNSFRVGLDADKPGNLVTDGAFAISRNPLYVAFHMVLIGTFLIYPAWIFFVYMILAFWLIDRQVCIEENFLRKTFGNEYDDYCNNVRRYI